MFLTWLDLLPQMQAFEHRLRKRLWNQRFDLSIRETYGKISPYILPVFELIPRVSWLNTVYQEVVSLPFSSESQETILKNSFLCFMDIVTCDRGVGRRTMFIRKKGAVTWLLSQHPNITSFVATADASENQTDWRRWTSGFWNHRRKITASTPE